MKESKEEAVAMGAFFLGAWLSVLRQQLGVGDGGGIINDERAHLALVWGCWRAGCGGHCAK